MANDNFDKIQPRVEDLEQHKKFTMEGAVSGKRYFDDIIPMSEYEVRDALLQETKRHRAWQAAVVQKMEFQEIQMLTCLQYTLESVTEARSTSEASEAASHSAIFAESGPSCSEMNPWDYEVFPDQMFCDQVQMMELPGTSAISPCPVCNTEGTVYCFHCRGNGTDKCSMCRGTGMKSGVAHPAVYTHPMIATFPHIKRFQSDMSRGYSSSSTAMLKKGNQAYGVGTPVHFLNKTGVPPPGIGTHDLCFMCHGKGIRECQHCKGKGKKACTVCGSSGHVRKYKRLKIYFKVERSEFFTDCELPPKYLRDAKGKEIFSEEQPYVTPIQKYHVNEINEQSRRFCTEHLQKCMGISRVIRQRHQLVAIPVAKVNYKLGKKTGIFYVYGTERNCYFPNYPSKCTIL